VNGINIHVSVSCTGDWLPLSSETKMAFMTFCIIMIGIYTVIRLPDHMEFQNQ